MSNKKFDGEVFVTNMLNEATPIEKKLLEQYKKGVINRNELDESLEELPEKERGTIYDKMEYRPESYDEFLEVYIEIGAVNIDPITGLTKETINEYMEKLRITYLKLMHPSKLTDEDKQNDKRKITELKVDAYLYIHILLGIKSVQDTDGNTSLYFVDLSANQYEKVTEGKLKYKISDLLSTLITEEPDNIGYPDKFIKDIMEYTKGYPIQTHNQYYQFEGIYVDTINRRIIKYEEMSELIYTQNRAIVKQKDNEKNKLVTLNPTVTIDWIKQRVDPETFEISESVGETVKTIWDITVDKTNKNEFHFWEIVCLGIIGLIGLNIYKTLPILYSAKSGSGKTTLLRIFRDIIFPENSITSKLNTNDQFDNLLKKDKNLMIIDETPDNFFSNDKYNERLKSLTGGGGESAREMFGTDEVKIENFGQTIIATNDTPKFRMENDNDRALYDRAHIIEFPNKFVSLSEYEELSEDEKTNVYVSDPNLFDRLIYDEVGISNFLSLCMNTLTDDFNNFYKMYGEQTQIEKEKYLVSDNPETNVLKFCFMYGGKNNAEFMNTTEIQEIIKRYYQEIKHENIIPEMYTNKGKLGLEIKKEFNLRSRYGKEGVKEINGLTYYNLVYTGYIEDNQTKVFINVDGDSLEPKEQAIFNTLAEPETKTEESELFKYILEDKCNTPQSYDELVKHFENTDINVFLTIEELKKNGLIVTTNK